MSEAGCFLNIAPDGASGCGMVRLIAQTKDDKIAAADIHIGFAHRGVEKTLEYKNVLQGLTYFDSLRMLTPLSQEHAFVLAVEKLCGVDVPVRARRIRLILAELSRIASHLNALGVMAAEIGQNLAAAIAAQTNRKIASLTALACGAPVPKAFFRAGGVKSDVSADALAAVCAFLKDELPAVMSEICALTVENALFESRTRGVGVIGGQDAAAYGLTGVNLRASGRRFDVRKAFPYDDYDAFSFETPSAAQGDCHARALLRSQEIFQSAHLITQAARDLPDGDFCAPELTLSERNRPLADSSLAGVAARFDYYASGMTLARGESFVLTEAPYGVFGVYLVSDGGITPYRCRIRSAGFAHLQALKQMAKGCDLQDVRLIFASLDIQMPEVDR